MSSSSRTVPGHNPLTLRQTNVSNPSVVVAHKTSQQSLTASEDFYSLSDTSSQSTIGPSKPAFVARRDTTPASQYRTPLQSKELLLQNGSSAEVNQGSSKMQGKSAYSPLIEENYTSTDQATNPGIAQGSHAHNLARKPIPGANIEPLDQREEEWPLFSQHISPTQAESSVARGLALDNSPPTPGMDDAPFIRFALEQLTRDEEVRGSRTYPGTSEGPATAQRQFAPPQSRYSTYPQNRERAHTAVVSSAWPARSSGPDTIEPPPRHPNRPVSRDYREVSQSIVSPVASPVVAPLIKDVTASNVFVPVSPLGKRFPVLNFRPAILRTPALALFLLSVLVYIACLMFCAIWSLRKDGLWRYSTFGDGRYFIFQYLPSILGVLLFCWLVQIEAAIYRITPYIALSSNSVNHRHRGVRLPLTPTGFVLPYLGHFRAGQPVTGTFLLVAWLQIFTVPLLASSFNVYYFDLADGGSWRWIATQGTVWAVIGLYILLFLSTLTLMFWLARVTTGLKWDARSLADAIVLLERSNALGGSRTDEHVAQLGYWRTAIRPNEVFHTYGIADKAPRQYAVEEGRIREKSSLMYLRFSPDADPEAGSIRHSRERMLGGSPRHSLLGVAAKGALPWFLRPSFALLWQIAAIVLLAAFLVVSYLPATRVSAGFSPDVPAPVNTNGFSATNFLYSFIPSLLAMLCLLIWLDIDYTYRRLQPFASLNTPAGEYAERSLLLSYAADLPIVVTLSALANGHFRVAWLSFVSTFVAPALAMIGGGVFWAQFYVQIQKVRISAHMPAYYALTAFFAVYALSFLFIFPSRAHQFLYLPPSHITTGKSDINSFSALLTLMHQSKLLDDVAFHGPSSKTDLVTRLLSSPPGAQSPSMGENRMAASSKISLADGVRGFGNARQKALVGTGVPRYTLGRYSGRDGRDYFGIDRF